MKTKRFFAAASAALLLGLGACGDKSPTKPTDPDLGSLRASYSGSRSGTIDATGTVPKDGGPPPHSFALGIDLSDPEFDVPGGMVVGIESKAGRMSSVMLLFAGARTGEFALDPECGTSSARCAAGLVQLDLTNTGVGTEPQMWELVSGRVTVTANASGRMRGTFTGTARLLDPDSYDYVAGQQITLSGGTFDVPVRDLDLPTAELSRVPARPAARRFRLIG